jgi:hypothetical protein
MTPPQPQIAAAGLGVRFALVSVLLFGALFTLTAAPASAARPFENQITGVPNSAPPPAVTGAFSNPRAIAIDDSNNLWVSDPGKSVVSKFDAAGGFLAQNDGTGSWSGSPYIQGLAFGNGANLMYVADSGQDDIWGLNVADASYANVDLEEGLGGGCCYIYPAVDNSGTGTDGYIYVTASGTSITRITPTGGPANFTAGSAGGGNVLTGTDTPSGSFNAHAIAVDAHGNLYVVDPFHAVVDKFAPSGAFLTEFDGTGTPSGFSGAGGFSGLQGVAIDPTNEDVLVVDHGNDAVYEFDASGVYLEALTGTGPSQETPFGNLNGSIAVSSTGNVYVADSGTSAVDVYGTGVVLPKISYGPVTAQTHTSGTLNASIDINGGPNVTSCVFQYGVSPSYGTNVPCSPPTPYASNSAVSADVAGLTPETTYHYRVVLITANGTRNGADQTFTPRAVIGLSTDAASDITATGATLNGSFTGEAEDVHYYFEWSRDNTFGNRTAIPPGTLVPAPIGSHSVSFALANLRPATAYRFRIVASNSHGTTVGSAQTFTTLGQNQFSRYFGSSGSGDGQLENPKDVAVDFSSGDVYVADTANHRVVRFDAGGNFISAWGWDVGGGSGYEVCAGGCAVGVSGTGAGQFEVPYFIEVDNSGGPSNGDVYVGDTGRGDVQKFDASGDLVESWGDAGAIDFASENGPLQGITVDDQGSLFVAFKQQAHWIQVGQDGVFRQSIPTGFYSEHGLGGANGQGIDINSLGSFYQSSEGGVDFAPPNNGDRVERDGTPGNPAGLAVDRPTGDLYVSHGNFIYQFLTADGCFSANGFATTIENCEPADSFGSGDLHGASGLAIVPSTGAVYAADTGDDSIAVFMPLPTPDIVTGVANGVGPNSATLTGHVEPTGSATITDCYFEYGTDPNLPLGTVPCAQSLPIVGGADVSAELTGLTSFTSYRYRLVASQSDGKGFPSRGSERSVTPQPGSLPGVDGTAVSDITETSARLSAVVNPNLAPTTYVFQYGPSSRYGSNTSTSGSIGADASDHPVSASIGGLDPGTTYHYRVVAVNFVGATPGPDMTFATPGAHVTTQTPTENSGRSTAPSSTPPKDCTSLAHRAALAEQRVSSLRRRAKRSPNSGQARALRAKAKSAARRARKLGQQVSACEGKAGGR